MKPFHLIIICIFFGFGCKKDASPVDDTPNYISATINGNKIDFNYLARANSTSQDNVYFHFVIQGNENSSDAGDNIIINLTTQQPLAKGTYRYSPSANESSADMIYVDNSNGQQVFLQEIPNAAALSITNTASAASITITSITATRAEGYFSSDVISYTSSCQPAIHRKITNGSFSLRITQ
jgi:hypothetical protein